MNIITYRDQRTGLDVLVERFNKIVEKSIDQVTRDDVEFDEWTILRYHEVLVGSGTVTVVRDDVYPDGSADWHVTSCWDLTTKVPIQGRVIYVICEEPV